MMENGNGGFTPEMLEHINRGFVSRDPETLLAWALASFAPAICLATSFGPQSIVLMHVLSRLRPETTVFYLDTSLLFPETYALRDELSRRLGLRIVRVEPELSLDAQREEHGPELWARQPDLCCHLRKVLPLRRFLAGKRAWITGVRRARTDYRNGAQLVEWDETNGLVKLNPLMEWQEDQVWDYIRCHDLPSNPLHDEGYRSIGCQPCTRAVLAGEESRAGRWPGFGKTECGIHGRLPLPSDRAGAS